MRTPFISTRSARTLAPAFAAGVAVAIAAMPPATLADNVTPVVRTVVVTPSPEPTRGAPSDPYALETPAPRAIDAKNVATALAWFPRLQKGEIDRTQLTPDFSSVLTESAITTVRDHLAPFGMPQSVVEIQSFARDGVSAYLFRVTWAEGSLLYQCAIEDATGKIAGLFTRPAPPAPSGTFAPATGF